MLMLYKAGTQFNHTANDSVQLPLYAKKLEAKQKEGGVLQASSIWNIKYTVIASIDRGTVPFN